ncbi:Histone-lysine N-methyltransferase [Abeliophyllum distichum]|uniref:Histone-lysine N-methyltransferase n=1 Tax=Abeliophyllum distichum TaxID=126358 RepID=A0ABD1UKS0_9LAMI
MESTKTLKDGSGRVPWGELLTGNAKPVVFQETLRSTVEGELMKETMGGGVGKLGAGLRDDDIEKTELRGPLPGLRTIPRSVLDNCDEDTGGSVRKEIVVYSPDMSDKRISSQNVFSSGHEVDTEVEVVQAPMAAPVLDNCDEDTGGSVGKEIVVYSPDMSDKRISSQNVFSSGHEVHMEIEVVQALRAAPVHDNCDEDTGGGGSVRKEIVVYSPDMSDKRISSQNVFSSGHEVHMEIEFVQALMAAPYCPWRKKEVTFTNSDGRERVGKVRKQNLPWRQKYKDVARKSRIKADCSGRPSRKKMVHVSSDADGSQGALAVVRDEKDFGANDEDLPQNSPASHKLRDFVLSLPAYGHNSSSHSDDRNKVRETLRLFHAICRKLLQEEEAKFELDERGKSRQVANSPIRIDLLAAKIIEEKKKEVNTGKQFLGEVPGVQVGDEFQYRVELAIVGIHCSYQTGIDSMNHNGLVVATSIVASGGYADDMENGDVLMYSGQGGNATGKDNEPQDQKLESGNLALRNSLSTKTPVRVIRGWKETRASESPDSRAEIVSTYIYDGLYTVKKYWTKTGHHGKLVFMFELRRNPGQPELAWKELKKSNKYRACSGVCVNDISEGKEPFPICAVNMMDSENHPQFNYITKMMYPDWFSPIPPEGCNCTGRCSDSRKCQCAVKNGGEIPFNHNGAIVEVKSLVYECGPSCKCPPSCYNRVSQRGIKFQLEIFKTESRGWGVRCLTFIPSGSFICEYAGELLEDKEAEQRIGNDEYLFDIGQNYNDSSLKPEESVNLIKFWEEDGFTIDAAQYGNIGRFINHSCSPNLYAQNVIYDHDDKRMPHVMLFAAENIPPLQELTYHYNYSLDQVLDSNGNIKIKRCYCGTAECSGRMY